jgi:beta-glucanase (GH16 family)
MNINPKNQKYFLNIVILLYFCNSSLLSLSQVCNSIEQIVTISGYCNDNDPWILVYEDDFNSTTLDLSKWKLPYQGYHDYHGDHVWLANTGNTPFIDYSNNIEVSGGYLKLITRIENPPIIGSYISSFDSHPYPITTMPFHRSSAKISSQNEFLYGKFEMRCMIPQGGFFPAYWLYGEYNKYNQKDKWNEIDIFEFMNGSVNSPSTNIHYDFNGDGETKNEQCSEIHNFGFNFSQNFKTFTLIWDEYKIEWYINDILIRKVNRYFDQYNTPLNCSQMHNIGAYKRSIIYGINPMELIINTAIHSAFQPDFSSYPAYFIIDYVRIWQKEKKCCITHKLYESTEELPQYTWVNEYIKAGNDAGISGISGDVIVKSGQNVSFYAGDYIDLLEGFTAENGSIFNAEILNCTSTYGEDITVKSIPNSFSPDNDGIDELLFIYVDGATHYTINVEDIGPINSTFYVATKVPINSNPVAVWDGSCNYTPNCWFYHKCNRQRRITLTFYNCDNVLVSQKVIDVGCNSKSLIIEEEDTDNEQGSGKSLNYNSEIVDFHIHPNPFSNSFTISIAQPEQTDAKIYLSDAYGRQVLSIFNGTIDKGQHSIDVSTDGITKGLYFCIMETPAGRNVVKVIKTE